MAKLFEFIVFCIFQLSSLSFNIPILHAYHLCPRDQSLSLLNFKNSLQIDTYKQRCITYSYNYYIFVGLSSYCDQNNIPIIESKISSWNKSTDCCSWEGVTCDEFNGKVIELDLSANRLTGIIHSNSSLFQLSDLKRLNLACNFLYGSKISHKFCRFKHISHLNFSGSGFHGQIPSEISQLNELVSLDLSHNYELRLEPHVFKVLLRNMTRLRELSLASVVISSSLPNNLSSSLTIIDLEFTDLRGTFPYHIFSLPNLQQLSLGYNSFDGFVSLASVKWNTSYPLQKLELRGASNLGELLDTIGNMKHLTYLDLSDCEFNGTLPQSFENLTQLSHLDLSDNQFSGQIPPQILGLEHLTGLDLNWNKLDAPIPHSEVNNLKRLKVISLQSNNFNASSVSSLLRNLTQLETIDLSYNPLYMIPHYIFNLSLLQFINLQSSQLHGQLPKSFSNLVNLQFLFLGFNNLSGSIQTEAISNLVNLQFLHLGSNNFSGPIEIDALSNLFNIKWMYVLDLSSSGLSLINEDNTTLPTVSIYNLGLGSCNIRDLDVLRSIVVETYVSLPNNHIHGEISEWVWSSWPNIYDLDLSNNFITHIGNNIPLESLEIHNLRSNLLRGLLPILPHSLLTLSLSSNQFHGEIKPSICQLENLSSLDLANNSFSGALPECIGTMSISLRYLDLHMNKLQGTIPDLFSMESLRSLNLYGNQFEGDLPRSLMNCSSLEVVILSENNLNDTFPIWLGDLPKLRILSLRSNNFYGDISSHHVSPNAFSQLQILDLSYNQLNGSLPARLLQKFRGMMIVNETRRNGFSWKVKWALGYDSESFMYGHDESMKMVLNGNTEELDKIFMMTSFIDLSCNHFEGKIPNSIGSLISIQQLNLSHNNFTGQIPSLLGRLSNLQSLDLSSNQFVGNIPDKIAALSFLSVMNLSYNHLTGRIPSGRQLGTFESDSYIGNDGLCGLPLTKNCGNDDPPQVPEEENDQEFFDGFTWQSVVVGYGVGICVGFLVGSLMLFIENPKWLIRIVKEEAKKILYKYKSRNGINQTWFKRS